MAQARTATAAASRVRVIAPGHLGETAVAALRLRGIDARVTEPPLDPRTTKAPANEDRKEIELPPDLLAWALDAPPHVAFAIELAAICARAAAAGRPVCVLVPPPHGSGLPAITRAAALSYLRAHGAAVTHDVDAWLEAIVLLVRFGMPSGPRAAIVAPAGSWLEAQAVAIAADAETNGLRSPLAAADDPSDVVLYDPVLGAPPATTPALPIPVAARGELPHEGRVLYGARSALGAVTVLGRAAERIAAGLGAAPRDADFDIDRDRMARQLARLAEHHGKLGDHDTKVLLAAYGVPHTRQAVATTPSAAVNLARRAGYPVELKPFDNDLPSEPAGCPVEKNVTSDALVRQAFATVLGAKEGAVIVRETPPAGREVSVTLLDLPSLGWTVVLEPPGATHIAAAPAPLRPLDAQLLAAAVVASRASDLELDRAGLANLLRRASHLVVDLGERIVRLELPRVVVGGRASRTLVIDASAELT